MASHFDRLIDHRHGPFYAALVASVIAVLVVAALNPRLVIEAGAVVFFLTYLTLIGLRLPQMPADYLKERAAEADAPAPVIMLVTLAAVMVAMVSLFLALNRKPGGIALEHLDIGKKMMGK